MGCSTLLIISGLLSIVSGTLDLLWPLNNFTYTAEILQQPADQNLSGCSLNFGPDNLGGMCSAVFDGDTSLDILVESSVDGTGKDYAFSGWFWLIKPTGSLFHYKANNSVAGFQEMKLVVISQYMQATRVVNGGTSETETSSMAVVYPNTWHYISFGIDRSSGKISVEMDGTTVLDNDNGFFNDIDIEFPGVLRIGRILDDSISPLTGYVTCIGYHTDDNIPTSTDSFNLCSTSQSSVSSTPICTGQNMGQFVRYSSTNNLQELVSSNQCSIYQCALCCLRLEDCRYIQYDEMATGCTTCLLLRFGDGNVNTSNGFVYKFEVY